MKKTTETHATFKLRPYRKGELALMYFPESSKTTAIRSLRRWMINEEELMKDLASVGYDKNRQYLHKHEVALIVKYFGEPY